MTLMENKDAQPGQTVTPTPPAGTVPPAAPVQPAEVPAPAPGKPAAERQPVQEPEAPPGPETPDDSDPQSIVWTASEFIAHAKSFGWYAALAVAAAVAAALIFLLTRDPVSTGVILVAALILGIYAGHQPRELEYRLDPRGLTIGQKHFTFDQFRSFSVLPEDAFSSIVLMPLRRFAVTTTIYYAPQDEDRIVGLLSDYLPLEEHGHDAIDRLLHKIRF